MSRIKQIAFYGIMVVLTLAVIEAMAQAAYYIAYGEFNGGGPAAPTLPTAGPQLTDAVGYEPQRFKWVSHPYHGYTQASANHELNRVPPPRRQDDTVLIALLGGSVSREATPAFRSALEAWFRDNDIPLRPVVLELAFSAMKQPQQVMIIANALSVGGEYDIVVNLDGYNELVLPEISYFWFGLSPFYPPGWHQEQAGRLTSAQRLAASRIYALRQRQQQLDGLAAAAPWRWSALYGIVNRYLREQAAARILTLNRALAAEQSGEYSLQRLGPVLPSGPDESDLSSMALRVWYRGSALLADLSRAAGAEYYHFQQPSQYVPDAKPLSDRERAVAYDAESVQARAHQDDYRQQLRQRLGAELRQQGINFHDLTQIFADNTETLYRDDCCHLTRRGYELLAANMVQRLEPELRRLVAAKVGGEGGSMTDGAATALYPATQEITPFHAVNKLHFDVRYTADHTLRYSRDACRPADTAEPFFVQITPLDAADLLPEHAAAGYNRDEFSFADHGGATDAAGRCAVHYQLPDYEIANALTGQYNPETGQPRWRARITLDWGFAVARTAAGALRYSRDNCALVHTAANFFLHITPADAADLHPGRAEHGYNNYDFPGFNPIEVTRDAAGGCVVERALPEYDLVSALTGQYIPASGRRLWETRLDFE